MFCSLTLTLASFSDFMEMMMIQHQQMHQMVMQQMMLSQLPGANRGIAHPATVYAEPTQPVVVHRIFKDYNNLLKHYSGGDIKPEIL